MNKRRDSGRRRPSPVQDQATRFLVVCEGQTEEAYFTHINRILGRGVISVESIRGKRPDPEKVVQGAIDKMKGDPRRGMSPKFYDEVWAVFDWDGHTDEVSRAKATAEHSGVRVALSNPSLEVWFLWHFTHYMTLGCLQRQVENALAKWWPSYRKGLTTDFQELQKGSLGDALRRAAEARQTHGRNGTGFPEDRPSSDIERLLTRIIDAWKSAHEPGRACPLQ